MSNRSFAHAWALLAAGALLAPAAHAACTYSISPTNTSHGYGAATNSVAVTAGTNCLWTVSQTNPWITILPGWSGSYTGVVTYTVAANPDLIGRTGTVTIAGQIYTVRQDPARCNYSLSPGTRTHGRSAATNSFSVITATNCSWSVLNTSLWITLTGITNAFGSNSVSYSVAANTTPIWRTSDLAVADQTFVMLQQPAPCIYELGPPTNRNHGYAGSTGAVLVAVTSGGTCSWYANNTNDWITITANSNGTGNVSFGYSVASNSVAAQRIGNLTVWDQVFTVSQNAAPCSPSLSPTSSSPGADPETNTVIVSMADLCPWTVTNNNSWITPVPASGVGSGSVSLIVGGNTSSVGRTGIVSIAGQNFTVRQDAANCTAHLSPTNRIHGNGSAANSVTITTLSVCGWNVVNTNTWVNVVATNGAGTSNIAYTVAANTGANDRAGVVLIGGQAFTITQHGVGCSISLSFSTRNHGYSGASNYIGVTIGDACLWNALNTNSWITLLTNNGVGSNQVGYLVGANPTPVPRSGYVTVEEGSVQITQNPAPCTNGIVPPGYSHSPAQETGTVSVAGVIGCSWTVVNTNFWVTILSGTNFSGSTDVIYQVDGNLTGAARSGVIMFGDQGYAISQNGVTCNYKLSPAGRTHGASAVTNFMILNVSNACPWSVLNTNSWINILSNASGVGSNNITYSVNANVLSHLDRVGSVIVAEQLTTITQHGVACSYTLTPGDRTHGYGAVSNSFTVTTADGCAWGVTNTNAWITITAGASGTNSDTVQYIVDANTNLTDRVGVLAVDGQTFTITQRSATCSFSLSPASHNHGYAAATNTVDVNTTPGCAWQVSSPDLWVSILTNASGLGVGTMTYAVTSNLDVAPRVGSILVGDQTFVITQAAYLCTYKLSPTNRLHGFGANTNTISITAGPSCVWEVANTNDWISIIAGSSGAGSSNFVYSIQPNAGSVTRTGFVAVLDQMVTISQSPSTGGFAFEPVSVDASGNVTLKLNGGPPGIWDLQGSSNVVTWTKVGSITNTTGRIQLTIPATSAATNHFFRALLP